LFLGKFTGRSLLMEAASLSVGALLSPNLPYLERPTVLAPLFVGEKFSHPAIGCLICVEIYQFIW
jgi:hypothetical protein